MDTGVAVVPLCVGFEEDDLEVGVGTMVTPLETDRFPEEHFG